MKNKPPNAAQSGIDARAGKEAIQIVNNSGRIGIVVKKSSPFVGLVVIIPVLAIFGLCLVTWVSAALSNVKINVPAPLVGVKDKLVESVNGSGEPTPTPMPSLQPIQIPVIPTDTAVVSTATDVPKATSTITPDPTLVPTVVQPTASPTQPAPSILRVKDGLEPNVRPGPGTFYEPAIGQAQPGKDYIVDGQSKEGGWFLILFDAANNQKGWITPDFVEVTASSPIPIISDPPFRMKPTPVPTIPPPPATITPIPINLPPTASQCSEGVSPADPATYITSDCLYFTFLEARFASGDPNGFRAKFRVQNNSTSNKSFSPTHILDDHKKQYGMNHFRFSVFNETAALKTSVVAGAYVEGEVESTEPIDPQARTVTVHFDHNGVDFATTVIPIPGR